MRSIVLLVAALTLQIAPLEGQEGEWPTDWKVRFDRAGTSQSDIEFVTMSPGWHITTGPAAILYNPERTASGTYRIQTTIFLFDPGQRHAEAYGILFGGQNLEGDDQSYSYLLIRDTGHFLVKRRMGAETEEVVDWTPSDAIMKYPGGGEQAKNVLAVECGREMVDFYINDTKVTSVPRAELDTDGIVGLRINHQLNVHVSELAVESMGMSGSNGMR